MSNFQNNSFNNGTDVPTFRSATIMAADQSPSLLSFRQQPEQEKMIKSITTPAVPEKMTSVTMLSNGWNTPQLTTVALYFPLGPSVVRLSKDALANLLESLPEMFRKLSLQALYNDCPISVTARSLESVELEISIFQCRDNSDELVVEFQRRDGDCAAYHQYAHQIMSAIAGGAAVSPVCGTPWNHSTLSRLECIPYEETPEDSVVGAIDIAWSLISNDRYDARKLGLESLKHMSDPNTSGMTTSKAVAEYLLFPQTLVQQNVSRNVFGYACRSIRSTTDSDKGADEAEFTYLALIIISQCFRIAARDKSLDIPTFVDLFPGDLVESILEKVHDAKSHPHHAFYAVQSLVALCECAPSLRSRINGRDVEEAHLYGDSCHFALATASQQLLLALGA